MPGRGAFALASGGVKILSTAGGRGTHQPLCNPSVHPKRKAYVFLTCFFFFLRLVFFFGALAWSFLEFLLKIEFSRKASSNFHKTSCFSVKLLQISIKNPLKLVFSSNEEGRKEGKKEG